MASSMSVLSNKMKICELDFKIGTHILQLTKGQIYLLNYNNKIHTNYENIYKGREYVEYEFVIKYYSYSLLSPGLLA